MKMEPLVEVHNREELDRVIDAGAKIIGVNNRDLRDFKVRIETSLELIEAIPEDCVAVSESGLAQPRRPEAAACGGLRRFPDWRARDEIAGPGRSAARIDHGQNVQRRGELIAPWVRGRSQR